jgi:bis(5'-nucleosidyl)-tetraphosphatase
MREELSAGAIIYHYTTTTDSLRYLLLETSSHQWGFAKGKVENDETPTETAIREIQEETGLLVSLQQGFKYTISYHFKSRTKETIDKTVIIFVAEAPSTNIILSFEHTNYAWATLEEALELLTFDNSRQVLQEAHLFIINSLSSTLTT